MGEGSYAQEDEAVAEIVAAFEQETGKDLVWLIRPARELDQRDGTDHSRNSGVHTVIDLESILTPRVLSTTVVVAFVVTLILAFYPGADEWFNEGTFSLTYQFALIVIIGGFVALALRAHEQRLRDAADDRQKELARQEKQRDIEREQRERLRLALNRFYSDLITSYNQVKKIRRLLRAKSFVQNDGRRLDLHEYQQGMADLEDVQLKIEQIKKEVEVAGDTMFGQEAVAVRDGLGSMEDFVRDITKNYERRRWKLVDDAQEKYVVLDEFTRAFVSSSDLKDQTSDTAKERFYRPADQIGNIVISRLRGTPVVNAEGGPAGGDQREGR